MKIFIVLFFFTSFVFGQRKSLKDTITYREYSRLTWKDFKAKVPEGTKFSASVSSGMGYKWSYSTSNGQINFNYSVKTNLYRNSSWSKYTEGKESVLRHEQLHYDITELYVRKFREALKDYKENSGLRNIRKDVTRIYQKIEEERKSTQLQYDMETNHSLNKEAQVAWEQKIASLLQEYEAFK